MILIIVNYLHIKMNITHRDSLLTSLRPEITVDEERVSLPEENFQQTTLRPILKLQNALILAFFQAKTKEYSQPSDKKERDVFVENTLRKDLVLRNQLVGLVIGLFTEDEFAFYLNHSTSLTKRITQLLIKRIQDQF